MASTSSLQTRTLKSQLLFENELRVLTRPIHPHRPRPHYPLRRPPRPYP